MKTFFVTTFIATFIATQAGADHGPGTSGSGFNTYTAETLKSRQWSAAFHFDWTEFDSPSESATIGKDHFDFIDRSFLTTFGMSLGVTDNFQIGLGFGYYSAEGTRRIAHHEGTRDEHAEPDAHAEASDEHAPISKPQMASFDPDGWTDLWLTAKYRVYRGPAGQVAIIGGLKFPVGESRVIDSAGERIEPASAPGSGAWDGMLGAAYTVAIARNLALDASAQYTLRGEKFDYRLGNRIDAGIALGWRVAGSAQQFPQVVLMGETTMRSVEKSDSHGQHDANTGGTVLFLSPGVRVGFSQHASLSIGVQIPIVQELNGDQVETEFRVTTSLNIAF